MIRLSFAASASDSPRHSRAERFVHEWRLAPAQFKIEFASIEGFDILAPTTLEAMSDREFAGFLYRWRSIRAVSNIDRHDVRFAVSPRPEFLDRESVAEMMNGYYRE